MCYLFLMCLFVLICFLTVWFIYTKVISFPKFQLLVKKYTMERLAEVFRGYCLRYSNGSINQNEYDWIPGKILRCFFDKDFR